MTKGKHRENAGWSVFAVGVGFGAVVAGEGGLLEVFLPLPGGTREELEDQVRRSYPDARGESPLSREAARLLEEYFAGRPVEFDLPVDESRFTPFQRSVYEVVRRIPRGEVLTYGQVAAALGRPRSARGIGVAMARNPLPIIIPCHRVVGAGGAMTGYSGPGGIETKRRLLDLEGAEVAGSPRTAMKNG